MENNYYNNTVNLEKYFIDICKSSPTIVLNTQCGQGKYKFMNITYRHNKMVLEFHLLEDDNFEDSYKINTQIGKKCYLTANQFLFVFDYRAYT